MGIEQGKPIAGSPRIYVGIDDWENPVPGPCESVPWLNAQGQFRAFRFGFSPGRLGHSFFALLPGCFAARNRPVCSAAFRLTPSHSEHSGQSKSAKKTAHFGRPDCAPFRGLPPPHEHRGLTGAAAEDGTAPRPLVPFQIFNESKLIKNPVRAGDRSQVFSG